MFDSFNADKHQHIEKKHSNEDDYDIPEESGLDGNCLQNIPQFKNPSKRSPYIHKDQIIEEEEDFVKPHEQFGFRNLNSYISQMDRWIEEGKTFK